MLEAWGIVAWCMETIGERKCCERREKGGIGERKCRERGRGGGERKSGDGWAGVRGLKKD